MSNFERVVVPNLDEPECPAGQAVAETDGGSGCRCLIARDTLTAAKNGPTLGIYCYRKTGRLETTGDEVGYTACPVWRADKEDFWAERNNSGLLDRVGDLRRGHPEDRDRDAARIVAHEARERYLWEQEQERK